MVFGELGALGLVLPRVALEVGERVERRRREPQAQAMPKRSLKTLKSPERGSFMKPRSTMLEMNEYRGRVYY